MLISEPVAIRNVERELFNDEFSRIKLLNKMFMFNIEEVVNLTILPVGQSSGALSFPTLLGI